MTTPTNPRDELKAWKPCVERGITCDGKWHRGWDGHDPYCQPCPRPKPEAEATAHELLGEFCACYAEAWSAETCAIEAKKLADRLSASTPPPSTPGESVAWAIKAGRADEFITRFEDDTKMFEGKDDCTIQPLYAASPRPPVEGAGLEALVREAQEYLDNAAKFTAETKLDLKVPALIKRLLSALTAQPRGLTAEDMVFGGARQMTCDKCGAQLEVVCSACTVQQRPSREAIAAAWMDEYGRWLSRRTMDKSCYEILRDRDPDGDIGDDTFQIMDTGILNADDARDRREEMAQLAAADAILALFKPTEPK